jgi:hypothetical protein
VQEFLVILIIAFILFGVLRRMMFGSFYAALQKQQREQDQREQEERKRKKEGKIIIEKVQPGNLSKHDDGEYIDYEEIK